MSRTAKRRWSRELSTNVDGIAIQSTGPVLVHGYDPPPGGKWIEDTIPAKLGALDRNTGETLWWVPCEVGYGRGFGAGRGARGQVLVLGPSPHGHRIVRMTLESGELIEAAPIPAFDEVHVAADLCLCVTAGRVFAIDSEHLVEGWQYSREGERYRALVRMGDRVLVLFSRQDGRCGVLALDAENGHFEEVVLPPSLPTVHGMVGTADVLVLLTEGLDELLEGDAAGDLMRQVALHPSGGSRDTLSLLAFRPGGDPARRPLWLQVLETGAGDDLPEASLQANGGKLYLERGTRLQALDALSGRALGEWTVPGLDEQVAWAVADGAGLLAEETRVSVFELPA